MPEVRSLRSRIFAYLLLAPYLVVFAVFMAYPIVRGVYMSFFDWGIFGPLEFVGIRNYLDLAGYEPFWQALQQPSFSPHCPSLRLS